MSLSERALSWLRTLQRQPHMPTSQAERLIRAAGATPHGDWLEFHDEFAGYVEPVGPEDFAVWGLATPSVATSPPRWRQPDRIHILPGRNGGLEAIVCADANPVHEYELRADGWFRGIGGPCPSFAMKIERHGVMHELHSRGKVRETVYSRRSDPSKKAELLDEMRPFLVPEASSDDTQFFLSPARVLQFDPKLQQMLLYDLV